jgi:hypothetical protein
MSNFDNQMGPEDQTAFSNRTPNNRTGLDNRRSGMARGPIAAIIAAVVIIGALMLFGPWGHNRTADNNSTPATSNSTPRTTIGQTSPTVMPAAPTTTAPAPTTVR